MLSQCPHLFVCLSVRLSISRQGSDACRLPAAAQTLCPFSFLPVCSSLHLSPKSQMYDIFQLLSPQL